MWPGRGRGGRRPVSPVSGPKRRKAETRREQTGTPVRIGRIIRVGVHGNIETGGPRQYPNPTCRWVPCPPVPCRYRPESRGRDQCRYRSRVTRGCVGRLRTQARPHIRLDGEGLNGAPHRSHCPSRSRCHPCRCRPAHREQGPTHPSIVVSPSREHCGAECLLGGVMRRSRSVALMCTIRGPIRARLHGGGFLLEALQHHGWKGSSEGALGSAACTRGHRGSASSSDIALYPAFT